MAASEHNFSLARRIGLGFVFLWFFIGGIAHFAFTEVEMQIVPPWVPYPRAMVWVSGAFELLGAFGIAWRPTRRAAGWGLIALTLAVTPANIYMLQQHAQWPSVPYWALVLRLPLQLALIALIAWSTAAAPRPTAAGMSNGGRAAAADKP
jgi:uncharacterized membrane protein